LYPYFLFMYWRATAAHCAEYVREFYPYDRLPEVEAAVRMFAPLGQLALEHWRKASLPERQAAYDNALDCVRGSSADKCWGNVSVAYQVSTRC